nr:hypothetical protein [Tanacetum cinerariifolium]
AHAVEVGRGAGGRGGGAVGLHAHQAGGVAGVAAAGHAAAHHAHAVAGPGREARKAVAAIGARSREADEGAGGAVVQLHAGTGAAYAVAGALAAAQATAVVHVFKHDARNAGCERHRRGARRVGGIGRAVGLGGAQGRKVGRVGRGILGHQVVGRQQHVGRGKNVALVGAGRGAGGVGRVVAGRGRHVAGAELHPHGVGNEGALARRERLRAAQQRGATAQAGVARVGGQRRAIVVGHDRGRNDRNAGSRRKRHRAYPVAAVEEAINGVEGYVVHRGVLAKRGARSRRGRRAGRRNAVQVIVVRAARVLAGKVVVARLVEGARSYRDSQVGAAYRNGATHPHNAALPDFVQ